MVCLLFSGGLDSMVLAEKAKRENKLGALFHVAYGQRSAAQEYRAAKRWADKNQIHLERSIVSVRGLEAMNSNPEVLGPRVVPARNLLLISLAVNFAASKRFDEVWFGACEEDFESYPDCRSTFVDSLNSICFATEQIKIEAPLLKTSKKEILDLAKKYNLKKSDAWSCYAPKNDKPCGRCNSCLQYI